MDSVRDGVVGVGAWHPSAHSWEPLPASRGRLNILLLGSPSLFLGATRAVPRAAGLLLALGVCGWLLQARRCCGVLLLSLCVCGWLSQARLCRRSLPLAEHVCGWLLHSWRRCGSSSHSALLRAASPAPGPSPCLVFLCAASPSSWFPSCCFSSRRGRVVSRRALSWVFTFL